MLTTRGLVYLAHFAIVYLVLKLTGFSLEWCFPEITRVLTFVLVSALTLWVTKGLFLGGRVNGSNKSVVITGCDSGFGHELAKRLDSRGFHIFASCFFPNGEGAEALRKNCSKRLRIFELDVTKDGSVKSALSFVKDNLESTRLWAIVNNAGMLQGFSAELSNIDDFKATFNVNVLGTARMTKAFLPLLREHKGRIVNVTSFYGRLVNPYITPYITSKWAAVGYNNCLRQEMAVWGVPVVSVEPELFRTQITNSEQIETRWRTAMSTLDTTLKEEYGDYLLDAIKRVVCAVTDILSPKLNVVIDDMELAVTAKNPDVTYKPRRNFVVGIIIFFYINFPEMLQDYLTRMYLEFVAKFPSAGSLRNAQKHKLK